MLAWAGGKIMQAKAVADDRLFYTSIFVFLFNAAISKQGNYYKIRLHM